MDRLGDILIPGAAAKIAGNTHADLGLARVGILLQKSVGARDHPRCAEAALQTVMLTERLLQGMERAAGIGKAFDGEDLRAIGLHRKHGAGLYRLAVEGDRARAARAGVAADMRPSKAELLAQEMDEQQTRLGQGFD